MKRHEQIRVTPIDPITTLPIGEPSVAAVLDGYVQFSLMTKDQVREEFGFGEQRTGVDGKFTVTFRVSPAAYAMWESVMSRPQLAIESRAGQQRRIWDEYQRQWRKFWRDAIEDGLLIGEEPLTLKRWLPGERDPSKWTIKIGDEVHSLMRDIGLEE